MHGTNKTREGRQNDKKRKMSLHVEDVFFDNPSSESKKDQTIKQKTYTIQHKNSQKIDFLNEKEQNIPL